MLSRRTARRAGEDEMNDTLGTCGTAGEAVKALVRGQSPLLSVVPEDRSRVGEVLAIGIRKHHPV
jgi:hypothetical protein